MQTLDNYYNRLHQTRDWEALLQQGEHASNRHHLCYDGLPTTASYL